MTLPLARPELFHAVPCSTFQLGPAVAVVRTYHDGRTYELTPADAAVLAQCHGSKTLDQHVAAARCAGAVRDAVALRHTVTALVHAGLLRPSIPGEAPHVVPSTPVKGISTIVVITADRPRALQRCLQSITRYCLIGADRPRILVIDGSRSRCEATRAVASETRSLSGLPLSYVGQHEARRLRHRLALEGIPRDVLEASLTPGEAGANRNLATILTVDEDLLMLDDDIVFDPWARTDREDGLVVWGHGDPREWEFCVDREQAVAGVHRVPDDLLSVAGAPLRQSLSALLGAASGSPDLSCACRHLIAGVASAREFSVSAAFLGLAGDAGRSCPRRLLFRAGRVRQLLLRDPDAFRQALTSREVRRIVKTTTITHDSSCMAGCMALANDRDLPPFSYRGRNEDGLFGAMMMYGDSTALFAHLPFGIIHDSDRQSSYTKAEQMPSASYSRLADVLLLCLQGAAESVHATSTRSRLHRLADCYLELGNLDARTFAHILVERVLASRSQMLMRLESDLAAADGCPAHWLSALDEYRRALRDSVARPEFCVPVEFRATDRCLEDGLSSTQSFFRTFGEMVRWWPTVRDAMRRVRSRGTWRDDIDEA